LDFFIRRTGERKSTVISTAVGEWLKLQDHPQIRFISPIPGVRRAALADGPQVWSIAEAWTQAGESDRSVDSVARAIGLRVDQVEAALSYWADNREEIDGLIDQVHVTQETEYAAWQRRQALDSVK